MSQSAAEPVPGALHTWQLLGPAQDPPDKRQSPLEDGGEETAEAELPQYVCRRELDSDLLF